MAPVNPIAEFRKFAAGETDAPVTRKMAQAVVRHIDSLMDGIASRERMMDEFLEDTIAAEREAHDREN